jgi:hypothetical protein
MYAYAKTLCYKNRDDLLRKRLQTEGEGATLTLVDIGHIIFGGQVFFPDESSLDLIKAFDLAFDEAHVRRACAKCGYLPSTRAALKKPRVRHEAIEGSDGSIDISADPLGQLYDKMEKDNHDAVAFLVNCGYTKATDLKLWIRRVTSNQRHGRETTITQPNTRERQDLLMNVSTAGHFFQVTNGGGPMNSNGALIAWARKDMVAKSDEMRKQKQALIDFRDTTAALALQLLGNERKPQAQWKAKWLKADLKVMIDFKRGPSPCRDDDEKLYDYNLKKLRELYEMKYLNRNIPTPDQYEWTSTMDAELQRLESGVVEDVIRDTALYSAIERDNEYLVTRLRCLHSARLKHVLSMLLDALPIDKEEALLELLQDKLLGMDADRSSDNDISMLSNLMSPAPSRRQDRGTVTMSPLTSPMSVMSDDL